MSLLRTSVAASVFLVVEAIWPWHSYSDPLKFVIVSDAAEGAISYMPVKGKTPYRPYYRSEGYYERKARQAKSSTAAVSMRTLVPHSSKLIHPQGLAVDQPNSRLLVADPDLKRIISYKLEVSGDKLLASNETTVADQIEARWVTSDSLGNVYFSDEASNKIFKVDAKLAAAGNTQPQVVFDGDAGSVSAPGGLATDNFNLYWTNKVAGEQAGVVVAAPVEKDAQDNASPNALSQNIAKAYGVCLANHNVYYTAPESTIYGMSRDGGEVVEITRALGNPRGCAWDGAQTMYIADRGQHGIYSLDTSQELLQEAQLEKVADFSDAFGLAIFSLAARTRAVCTLAWALLGLAITATVHDL